MTDELPIINVHGVPYADVTEALQDPDWRKRFGIKGGDDVSTATAELADQRTFHCPICHTRNRVVEAALSRHDNATRICDRCGNKQAESQLLLMRANMLEDPQVEWAFCPLMVANTTQLRRLAGIAQQLDLPFGLDFRIDTVLDYMGLHVLTSREMVMPKGDKGEAIVTALAGLKVAFLSPDQPLEMVTLSIRLRDWIALMEPDPLEKMAEGIEDVRMKIDARLLIPDEFTPDRVNPATTKEAEVGTLARISSERLPRRWQISDTGSGEVIQSGEMRRRHGVAGNLFPGSDQ